jgi:hypothetical protein
VFTFWAWANPAKGLIEILAGSAPATARLSPIIVGYSMCNLRAAAPKAPQNGLPDTAAKGRRVSGKASQIALLSRANFKCGAIREALSPRSVCGSAGPRAAARAPGSRNALPDKN